MSRFNRGNQNSNSANWRQPSQSQQQPQTSFQPRQYGDERPSTSIRFQKPSRRGRISTKVKDNVRNPVIAIDSLPRGQHLSKTTSELKNDPLYLEIVFKTPSEELRSIAEELNHFPGLDGLSIIVNETYENFCVKNLNFQRSISLSAYNYYITVLSWARILYLKRMNKYRLTKNELEFVDMVYQQGNYTIPKSVSLYLSGFGNFTTPSGSESKFNSKPYVYDDNGYFKHLEGNFFLYTNYPNISIAAQRILQDIIYTDDNTTGKEWKPNDIDLPWMNRCLGYQLSENLQHMQLQVYSFTLLLVHEPLVSYRVLKEKSQAGKKFYTVVLQTKMGSI